MAVYQTEAAVLCALNQPLRLLPLKLPQLKPGQVLVEMAYSGVCHSQLLEARGKRGPDRFLPHTLGHEGAGRVIEVGPGVTKVQPDDRVVLTWIKGKGRDVSSTVYDSPEGPVNSGAISTFQRHTITCENRLVPIPSEMPLREAALLGCAIPTGAGLIRYSGRITEGSSVAVFGVGGIGLSAVMAARLCGATTVIAVDVVPAKLADARGLGATHQINARDGEPVKAVRELTGGRGVDCAVESAGRRETMEAAFQSVRDQGGLCILAGNLPHGERISLDPFDLIRGKQIVGTWGGGTQPDVDIPYYAQWFLEGRLPLEKLISAEYSLTQINTALEDLEQGRVARALVHLQN
jgi:S-(hydroxymethyl)glutathione dehydrogenase / alcohol dehydrogenase